MTKDGIIEVRWKEFKILHTKHIDAAPSFHLGKILFPSLRNIKVRCGELAQQLRATGAYSEEQF